MDIYFKADIKDMLVDFLFESDMEEFYFFDCKRYSAASFLISDKEQVSGRADFGMFRIFLDEQIFEAFLAKIKSKFKDENIKIFQTGIAELL